jgi:Lambda phage tail tube protein, TTP
MSGSIAARGSQLQRSTDNVTFVAIAEVIKVAETGAKADLADVTNFASASNFREYLPTLLDGGEFNFESNLVPGNATQTNLRSDFNNQTLNYWKLLYSNGTNGLSFQAYVVGTDVDADITKQISRQIKLKVSGPVTEF